MRAVGSLLLFVVASGWSGAQAQELSEVVVTARTWVLDPLESAQPVKVVSGDELTRASGVSLGATLAATPGISSSYFGPVADRPVVRGLSGYRVLVLNDGLASMDVATLSDDHAVTTESLGAQQIEVLRGPATLLHGSQGAGGVINVVSRRLSEPGMAAPGALAQIDVRADHALGERAFALHLGAEHADSRWRVEALSRSTDDFAAAIGRIGNSASESQQFALGYSGGAGPRNVALAFNHADRRYGLPNDESVFIDMSQQRIDLRGRQALDAWFQSATLAAAVADYEHTEFEEPGEPGTRFQNRQYDLKLHLRRDDDAAGRTVLGVQWAAQHLRATGEEAYVPASRGDTLAAFGAYEWRSGRLEFEAGARWDYQNLRPDAAGGPPDYRASAWNGSLSLEAAIGAQQRLAIILTHTERHPQLAELYAEGPHLALGRFERGAADLRRERSHTADLGWQFSWRQRLRARINAFYNRYANFVFAAPSGAVELTDDGDSLPVFEYRQQRADLRGAEFDVEATLYQTAGQRIDLSLQGDWLRGRSRDAGEPLPAMPAYRLGLGLDVAHKNWSGGVQWLHHAAQRRVAAGETPTRGFGLLEAGIRYRQRWSSSEVFYYLQASNLLDEDARLHASPLKDSVPLPGRSVTIGARASFGSQAAGGAGP